MRDPCHCVTHPSKSCDAPPVPEPNPHATGCGGPTCPGVLISVASVGTALWWMLGVPPALLVLIATGAAAAAECGVAPAACVVVADVEGVGTCFAVCAENAVVGRGGGGLQSSLKSANVGSWPNSVLGRRPLQQQQQRRTHNQVFVQILKAASCCLQHFRSTICGIVYYCHATVNLLGDVSILEGSMRTSTQYSLAAVDVVH
jgi:hypothetical protein